MTGESRTDLEALQRSGSGKILALAVVLLGALGAAAWFLFLEPRGIGNPEEAHRVLVVRSGNVAGYSIMLDRGGFDSAEGQLEHWVEKARDELPEVPEGSDLEIVVTLADYFGYGFVVFEHPQNVDFSELELASVPTFDDDVRFAALSIGDFASPHVLTVNPTPSAALRRLDISLLQALFAQTQLAEALPENTGASVDAIQLRSKLEEAIADLALVAAAEELVTTVHTETHEGLSDERGSAVPSMLGSMLASGSSMGLADGGVLIVERGNAVTTDNGNRGELDPAAAHSIWLRNTPDGERQPCTGIDDSLLAASSSPRFELAEQGGAFILETLGRSRQLWVASERGGCTLKQVGALPASDLDEVLHVIPHHSGKAVRIGTVAGEATLEVVTFVANEPVVHRIEFTGVALRDVAWLDGEHLVATGDDGLVYLASADGAGRILSFAPPGLGHDAALFEVSRFSERAVLLTVGSSPRRLTLVDVGRPWSEVFARPVARPESELDADEEETRPVALRLDPSGFSTTTLTRAGRASEPVASPDGTSVAFVLRDRTLDDPGKGNDSEIALVDADGTGLRLLTRNVVPDGTPRFVANGRWVSFDTRFEVPKTKWTISVPRVVPLR